MKEISKIKMATKISVGSLVKTAELQQMSMIQGGIAMGIRSYSLIILKSQKLGLNIK